MKSMIIIFITLLSFATFSRGLVPMNGLPVCPKPKIYNDCGSPCPPTCADPKSEVCGTGCAKGCFCPQGTLEDASGQCVTKCPKVYTDCGSLCPLTCANPNPRPCATVCVKGKFCPRGLLDNNSGECVLQCPKTGSNTSNGGSSSSSSTSSSSSGASSSSSNGPSPSASGSASSNSGSSSSGGGSAPGDGSIPKEYLKCGSACPPTCANPNPTCIEKCVEGLFCPQGTFENTSGQCVKQC